MTNSDLVALGIAKKQYPKRLYKYRTLQSAIRSLKTPSIYMSSILDFNDPYEGHYVLDGVNSTGEWANFIHKTNPSIPITAVYLKAVQMATNPDAAHKIIDEEINESLTNSGVFCFSAKRNSIPMWAYYADEHKGICVEYDPLKDEQLCDLLIKVKYSSKYVKFNYLRDQSGPTQAITQKSNCWKQEQEFRLIKIDKADKVIKINPGAVTSIILGCRFFECINEKNKKKKELKSLVRILKMRKYKHLQIKQCILNKDKYALQFKNISLSALETLVKNNSIS